MNKIIATTATLISAALFAGTAAAANGELDQEIVHGNATVESSSHAPYVRSDSGPKGTETDLISNLNRIERSGKFTPYVQTEGDRDNRDDLIDNV